jgi:hypothetical protein
MEEIDEGMSNVKGWPQFPPLGGEKGDVHKIINFFYNDLSKYN